MIELADVLDRLLQLLIIVDPEANLGHPLTTHAELLRASAGIRDRQNEHLVPFTPCAFRAAFAVPDGPLQQRATKQLATDRQFAHQLLARPQGPLSHHLPESINLPP